MKTRIPSPSRSQGAHTPRRKLRRTLSVGSPALSTTSVRLTSVVQGFVNKHMDSFVLSPLPKRRSVLTDNTDIAEEPRRQSWWKKLNENSRDVLEILEDNNLVESNNIMEELDMEILSQENKKNYTLDIPESSDGETINSIVIPQRKLFPQRESQHQKKFDQIIGTRESLTKSNKNMTINDKVVNVGTKELFQNKPRSKPLFPAALLNISPDKTVADKTKEFAAEPKTQVRNIFGNRQGAKRKNMFADFIVSESEDEIPEIQPRVFGFPKKPELVRRGSSASRGLRESSPISNVTTDTEMDDWKLLPSSTMVEHQLEAMMELNTPKRPRLSKLTETKESSGTSPVSSKSKSPELNTSVLTRSRLRALNKNTTSTVGEKNKTQEKSEQNQSKKSNQSQNNKSRDKIKESNKSLEQNKDQNTIADISQGKMNKSKGKHSKSLQKTNVSLTDGIQSDQTKLNTSKKNKSQSNVNETKNKSQNQSKEEIVENEQDKDHSQEVVDGNENAIVALEAEQSQEQIDEEQELQNEVNVNLENSKQKVIAKSQEVEESEEVDENKEVEESEQEEDENQEVESENEENESQEVAEENDKEEVEESQDQINLEQNDENEEQENESPEDFDESMEKEEEGQAVDQTRAQSDKSNKDINESQVDENDEEIGQTAGKVNESNKAADESNKVADQNQENEEVNESHQAADESNEVAIENEEEVDESNQAADESTEVTDENEEDEEEVDESNQAAIESNEVADQSQENEEEQVNESNQAADESNEAVHETQEINESNEVQNESEEAIENDENEATQEEVSESDEEENESEEDDGNDALEDDNMESENIYDTPNDKENNTNTPEPALNESNKSNDMTGRNRSKHTPEAVLHDKTKESDSFSARRNTSIRKTKSMINLLKSKPSLMPARGSIDFSDGTTNSSAEGSGWDSHRTTRKTIRQTFGKDATMRKSLRALVMEKSAKRQTMASEAAKFPLANSTALPDVSLGYTDAQHIHQESTHEVSLRTRQLTLDAVLEKIKEDNLKKKAEIEEAVKKSLQPRSDAHIFKVPLRPMFPRREANQQNKTSKVKPAWRDLPEEMLEDLQYKPPKRFKPSSAPWITKRLYKYLETKLEPKYDYKARVRAEKLVETLYNFTKDLRRKPTATEDSINVLKHEMARLQIVKTHHEFYEFFQQFMPKEVRIKVIPDVVNKIPLPKRDVFSEIIVTSSLQG